MKIVKEYINERFEEESDPVKDMGIGVEKLLIDWYNEAFDEPYDNLGDKNWILLDCIAQNKVEFVKFLIKQKNVDLDFLDGRPLRQAIVTSRQEKDYDMVKTVLKLGGGMRLFVDKYKEDALKLAEDDQTIRKLINEYTAKNESFTEDSDPVKDLNIGLIKTIKEVARLLRQEIEDVEIKDFSIILNHEMSVKVEEPSESDEYFWENNIEADFGIDYSAELDFRNQTYEEKFEMKNRDIGGWKYVYSLGKSNLPGTFNQEPEKIAMAIIEVKDDIGRDFIQLGLANAKEWIENVTAKDDDDLDESFTEDSDPVKDLNVGMLNKIEKWAKTHPSYQTSNERNVIEEYLQLAASEGKLEYVKYLIELGANIHEDNDLALGWAAEYGHTDVVKVLLKAGASIDADKGYALKWSAAHGHIDTVKELLKYNPKIFGGRECIRWARNSGHEEIVKLIEEYERENLEKNGIRVDEAFTDETDPIQDLGIGLIRNAKNLIEELKNQGFNIRNIVTNNDKFFITASKGRSWISSNSTIRELTKNMMPLFQVTYVVKIDLGNEVLNDYVIVENADIDDWEFRKDASLDLHDCTIEDIMTDVDYRYEECLTGEPIIDNAIEYLENKAKKYESS